MHTDSDHLLSRDGTRLFYQAWLPDECKKIVCMVHGHGEHSGRYDHFASFLNDHAIGVYALDLRGHGLSNGKRGHSAKQEWLFNDIEELLKVARAEFLDLPIYLFGHSMGGNLVANFIIQNDSKEVSGFILSSPWFKLSFDPPKWKKIVGDVMGRYWPSFSAPSGLNVSHISKIEAEVEKYKADPLVHGKITAGLFNIVSMGGMHALDEVEKIKVPGLVYHGSADQIVDPATSKIFAQSNPLLEWHEIKSAYHEPHNDEESEEVMKLVADWLAKH